jgi:hypothetical protein
MHTEKVLERGEKRERSWHGLTRPFSLPPSLPPLLPTLPKTFVTIWPNYLDADKSLPQGRRIPKDKACPRPSVLDISDLLVQWRLAHIVEQQKR